MIALIAATSLLIRASNIGAIALRIGSNAAIIELLSHFASDTIKETLLLKRVPIISEYCAKRLNELPIFENRAVNAFLNAIKVKRRINDLSFLLRSPIDLSCMPRFFFMSLKRFPIQFFKPTRAVLIFETPAFTRDTIFCTVVFTELAILLTPFMIAVISVRMIPIIGMAVCRASNPTAID